MRLTRLNPDLNITTGPIVDPSPELPADTPITMVAFPTIVRNALISAGLKTVGELRSIDDGKLRRLRRIGLGRLEYLRCSVGRS